MVCVLVGLLAGGTTAVVAWFAGYPPMVVVLAYVMAGHVGLLASAFCRAMLVDRQLSENDERMRDERVHDRLLRDAG